MEREEGALVASSNKPESDLRKRTISEINMEKDKKKIKTSSLGDVTPMDLEAEDTTMDTEKIHEIIGSQTIKVPKMTPNSSKQTPTVSNINTKPQQTQNTYTHLDKGPFFVIMEKENINDILISKYLVLAKLNTGLKEIRKLNQNKIRVELNSSMAANNIIKSVALRKLQQVNSYIPNQYINAVGVVRGVPIELTDDEINEYMISPVVVEKFERMTYWCKEDNCAKTGTSLKVTFRATVVPNEIKIFYVIKKVQIFVPKPIICRKCLKYGHTAKVCNEKKVTLCNNCTKETHPFGDASCKNTCIHCQNKCITKCYFCPEKANNHKTQDAKCPVMKKQYKIKENMLVHKIPYEVARNMSENGVGKESYANVTQLRDFNIQLLQRIKNNEYILNEILKIGQGKISNENKADDPRVKEIVKYISEQFKNNPISNKTNAANGEGSSTSNI